MAVVGTCASVVSTGMNVLRTFKMNGTGSEVIFMTRWYKIHSAVCDDDTNVKELKERYPALKELIMYDTVFVSILGFAENGVVVCVDDEQIISLAEKLGYPVIVYPESKTRHNYPELLIYDDWIE